MFCWMRVFLCIMMPLLLTACESEDPNPQERDPIFKDLEKRASDNQKAYDDALVKVKETREKLEKAEPNSIERKEILRELATVQKQVLNAQQLARFFKIRAERRKITDKIAYKKAFKAKQPWPDPNEYSEYLKNIQLQDSPRNWNIRVPKLQQRLVTAGKEAKKASGHEKKSGH